MTQFHYYTLEEVYEMAERMGFSREEVEVERYCCEYDYEAEQEIGWEYRVWFGHEYTEVWEWFFEDLEEASYDYEHQVWED